MIFDPNTGVELSKRPKALADRLENLWSMIAKVSDNLPPATLRWRVQNWMSVGQGRVERGLREMKVYRAESLELFSHRRGRLGMIRLERARAGVAITCELSYSLLLHVRE